MSDKSHKKGQTGITAEALKKLKYDDGAIDEFEDSFEDIDIRKSPASKTLESDSFYSSVSYGGNITTCHENGKPIFIRHGIVVRASAGKNPVMLRKNELLLDLLNGKVKAGVISARMPVKDIGEWIEPYMKHQHKLRINFDWPDMSAIDLQKPFWLSIIELCKRRKWNIHVACFGGHGRTGTVLAILAGLMGATTTDPVAYIRDKYCKHAVETDGQIDMIEHITGIKVKSKNSKDKGIASSSYFDSLSGSKPKNKIKVVTNGDTPSWAKDWNCSCGMSYVEGQKGCVCGRIYPAGLTAN